MVCKIHRLTHILEEPVLTEEQMEERFQHVFGREMTLQERHALYLPPARSTQTTSLGPLSDDFASRVIREGLLRR